MNTKTQTFTFDDAPIRILTDKNGNPWFAAKDICDVIVYIDADKAIRDHVDPADKINDESLSKLGRRGGWLVNETGLHSLVSSSKLPAAKELERWLHDEVLPTIHETGAYATRQTPETTTD